MMAGFDSPDSPQPKKTTRDPLHGVTLEMMITRLVDRHGWQELGRQIPIRCFQIDPSVKSSLVFLRKTPWARKRVEDWYAYDARRKLMPPAESDLKESGTTSTPHNPGNEC